MPTILLVEDDNAFAYAMERHLQREGHLVVPTTNTMDALEALDSDRPIDLMITDIGMPLGIPNGLALARMAALKRSALPVILITGLPGALSDVKLGEWQILQKPFELSELTGMVAELLAGLRDR